MWNFACCPDWLLFRPAKHFSKKENSVLNKKSEYPLLQVLELGYLQTHFKKNTKFLNSIEDYDANVIRKLFGLSGKFSLYVIKYLKVYYEVFTIEDYLELGLIRSQRSRGR